MRPGLEALQNLSLLASCPPAALARINAASDLARLGPREVLFREGDQVTELNILISGYAVTTWLQPGGNDGAIVDVVEPIKPIGLPAALFGGASPFGAQTITSARIIVIDAAELRATIRRLPSLESAFLDHALSELQMLSIENARLKLRTAAQRLAEYLLSLIKEPDVSPARFVLPFEKRFLAPKLGCSQENLSRIFAALRSIGVSTQGGVVVVRSVTALREYAGAPWRDPAALEAIHTMAARGAADDR
jgi:CRP-like cAMP-binding protein